MWPVLSGRVFYDADGDAVRDAGEAGFAEGGNLTLLRPDSVELSTAIYDTLPFAFPIRQSGIHLLTFGPPTPPPDHVFDITTPNLMAVLVLEEPAANRSATSGPTSAFSCDT